jgi:MoxR-like ATPase
MDPTSDVGLVEASPPPGPDLSASVPAAVARLIEQLGSVVYSEPEPVQLAVAAFLARGHVLLEDLPGVGKTVLAKALAASVGGSFGRVQGTPDLLPSDVTGVSVWEEKSQDWLFQRGPIFHNVVLVDELNRSTPRTQSALLEAMAERQVSVDGKTHDLPSPFFVISTQNPQDDVGTFSLVQGQRDRFMVSISLGLPGRDAEVRLIRGEGGETMLDGLQPVATLEEWESLRAGLDDLVFLHEQVVTYALDVVDAVRNRLGERGGLSTRAALAMLRAARGLALVRGRDHVAPEDVQTVAVACLGHRIVSAANDHLPTARKAILQILGTVTVPPTLGAD